MSLLARINKEQFDKLSADLKTEYREDGDSYLLDVQSAGGLQLANVTDLQNALQLERRKASEAEKKLKKFRDEEGQELDPETVKAALLKVQEMDSWDPDQKLREHKERFEAQIRDKTEKEKKALLDKHNDDLTSVRKENEVISTQLDETLRRNSAIAAINAEKGSVRGLLPVVMGITRVVRLDDGRRTVEVVGDNGLARLSPTAGNSNPMSVEELVKELRNDRELAGLFRGAGARGSGATSEEGSGSGSTAGQGPNPFLAGHWNLTAQAKLLKSDPGEYRKLQREAAAKEPSGMAAKTIAAADLRTAIVAEKTGG